MPLTRRTTLLSGFTAITGLAALAPMVSGLVANLARAATGNTAGASFTLTDAQWRRRLSPAAYAVLRQSDTEAPFTSPLVNEHRNGSFVCAGCALPLFAARTKYDSGTGWPSFWQPLPQAVATHSDYALGYPRTEVHCRRCAGHLGHVFNDGPAPTGLRYCMNGVALAFEPAPSANQPAHRAGGSR